MTYHFEKLKYELILDAIILKMGSIKPIDRPDDWEEKYEQLQQFKSWIERQTYVNVENDLIKKRLSHLEKELVKTEERLSDSLGELKKIKNNL